MGKVKHTLRLMYTHAGWSGGESTPDEHVPDFDTGIKRLFARGHEGEMVIAMATETVNEQDR